MTVKDLGAQLTRYFDGDTEKVKKLGAECKAIGFPLSENLQSIAENPEQFMLLITYSDLGVLGKLTESITKLKGN